MEICLLLRPSRVIDEHDTGHMTVVIKHSETLYAGFVFDPEDLPKRYRSKEMWREYLFDNTTPGYIQEDERAEVLHEEYEEDYRIRCEGISDALIDDVMDDVKPREYGEYSFLPDTNNAHNCVTWAIEVFNKYANNKFPTIPEGSVRRALEAFDNGN